MSHRLILLGTGTGVGKTFASVALVRQLRARGLRVLALKPIESGWEDEGSSSDAGRLGEASGLPVVPRYALGDPVSPHLAARRAGETIEIDSVLRWVEEHERRAQRAWGGLDLTLIESAGGVFSPLAESTTNFELAVALDVSARRSGHGASWLLLAADALGVLHDVGATLRALFAAGRRVDWVVLSASRPLDASAGLNQAELQRIVFGQLGQAAPRHLEVPVFGRDAPDCEDFVSELAALIQGPLQA